MFHQVFGPGLPLRLSGRTELHLARKIWHIFMGLVIVAVYMSGISRNTGVLILGAVLAFDLFMETARLRNPELNERIIRLWGPIMRKCETDRMSGVPYYIAASLLAIAIFPKPIAVLAILYLACGDPIASLVGIRYGHLSKRFANGKSLIGTAAGVLVCAMVTWVGIHGLRYDISEPWVLILVGGLAGGAAEMLPLEVDDNFSIPIVSGFALWLTAILLSI